MKLPIIGQAVASSATPVRITARKARNLLFEPRGLEEKSPVIAKPTPNVADSGITPSASFELRRLHFATGSAVLYHASEGGVYDAASNLFIAFSPTDAPDAYMASNSVRMIATDMTKLYYRDFSGGSQFDVPELVSVCGVGYLAGYFVAATKFTARLYYSEDGVTWAGLDFATAQQSADPLVTIRVVRDLIYLFGERSIEVWQPTGSANNPFAPVISATSRIGVARAAAVSADSDMLAFVGRPEDGDDTLYVMNGYEPQPISVPDIARNIQSLLNSARVWTFRLDGRPYIGLRYKPSGVGALTYWYDLELGTWHEITSDSALHGLASWVATANGLLAANVDSNQLPRVVTNKGESGLSRALVTDHISAEDFNRFTIDSCRVDTSYNDAESAPNVSLRVSRDGGKSWSSAITKPARNGRVQFNRLGTAREFTFELSTADDELILHNVFINAKN